MIKTPFRRAALVAATILLPLLGLAAPAQADPTTGTVTGRFTDSQGNGLQASVSVSSYDGSYFSGSTVDGYFTLEVTPGTYKVGFNTSLPSGQFTQYFPGKTGFDSADDVVVTAGATVTVNDTLVATGTINGRLADRAGNGVRANVTISSDGGGYFFVPSRQDGYYSAPVTPGIYRVSFAAELPNGYVQQYAYGVTDYQQATLFTVTADTTVTVSDTVLDTGTIAGRFTDRAGNGLASVNVEFRRGTEYFGSFQTEADGSYRSGLLPVGNYQVLFSGEGINQYAYSKIRAEDADPIAVVVDQETVVNDSQMPTGKVRIRAIDAVSNAPIARFSAGSGFVWAGDTTTGELVLDLPIGTHTLRAGARGYASSENVGTITITEGQETAKTIKLKPVSRIDVTVVDALTGEPVAGVCVMPHRPKAFNTGTEGCYSFTATGADGKALVETHGTGQFGLFVFPQEETAAGYGAQWVGANGGTGKQAEAVLYKVEKNKATAGPIIKLDRAGAITGQVLRSDGTVATECQVELGDPGRGGGSLGGGGCDEQGRYTVDQLGPYLWPLQFSFRDEAKQYSGGVANRHKAHHIAVTTGGSATYDFRFRAATRVTVQLTGALPGSFELEAFNAGSGDTQDDADIDENGTVSMMLLVGPQQVKFRLLDGEFSWCGGTNLGTATPYSIPGQGSVILTVQCG